MGSILQHLESAGPILMWLIIVAVVFAECAFLIGILLPGDSMMLAAGVLLAAANSPGRITALAIGVFVAAIAGNHLGYRLGNRQAHRLSARANAKYVTEKNLAKATLLLNRYGFWGVVLARFVPFVRTICPRVAGAATMNQRTFASATALGAVFWAPAVLLVGYFGGSQIEKVRWLMPVVLGATVLFVVVSTAVGIYKLRASMACDAAAAALPGLEPALEPATV